MASKLDPPKFGHRYPWAEWFRKKRFTLKRGRDFAYTVDIMARMIRNKNGKARVFGELSITVDYEQESLTVNVLSDRRK